MTIATALDVLQKQHAPDLRLNVWAVNLAHGALRGVAAETFKPVLETFAQQHGLECRINFLQPQLRYCQVGHAPLYLRAEGKEMASEILYGEALRVYDQQGTRARVAAIRDGYCGWIELDTLGNPPPAATHWLSVLRAHLFTEPKVSATRHLELALNSQLCVSGESGDWFEVDTGNRQGFVRKTLLTPLDKPLEPSASSLTKLARQFLDTPYVWGGTTAWGLDCSGLVQTVFKAHQLSLPRDADQQTERGQAVAQEAIEEADLLFFPGHVAIALDGSRFIHANAHHMRVTIDTVSSPYGQTLMQTLTAARRILTT